MAAKYEDGEVKVRRSTRDDMKAVAEMIQVRSVMVLVIHVWVKDAIFFYEHSQELADLEEMSDGPKLSVQGELDVFGE